MSDFVIIKNIKAPLADIQITDGMPMDNVDYALMLDVSLYEEKIKKGTGEENPDRTFVFEASGPIVMINKNKMNERIGNSGTITEIGDTPFKGEASGL